MKNSLIFLSICLILISSLLFACQPRSSSQGDSSTPYPSPGNTEQVSPEVNIVPVKGLVINEDPPRSGMFNINTLAYELPGIDDVEVINITYAYNGEKPFTMDIYYPPGTPLDARLPVVIFGLGYRMSSVPLRNSHQYTSWGKLVAAAGMIGVTYDTEQPDLDLKTVLAFIHSNATSLRIDPNQVGLWSCSANVPTVMSYLMQERRGDIRFSVYYYGLPLTLDHTYTEEFSQNCERNGCLLNDLEEGTFVDPELQLLVVKAGKDFIPNINEAMDHFLEYVQSADAPVTVIEYEDGGHGFDTQQHTEESAQIIAETLKFMLDSFGLE